MTGIAEDADSVMELVEAAARRHLAKEPEHELLGYLRKVDDDAVYAAFVERFGKKGIEEYLRSNATNTTWMWAQYLIALRKALGEELPPPTVEVRREIPSRRTVPEDEIDIPF